MKTFNDLVFNDHPGAIIDLATRKQMEGILGKDAEILKPMKQARIEFDNHYSMSVVFGEMFYSDGVDTYEAWCAAVDS